MLLIVAIDDEHDVCVVTRGPHSDYSQLASNLFRLLERAQWWIVKKPTPAWALRSNIERRKTEGAP